MITGPIGIIMIGLFFFFADERAANRAAHEICPETYVTKAGDHFEFQCGGRAYGVHCSDGDCDVQPR